MGDLIYQSDTIWTEGGKAYFGFVIENDSRDWSIVLRVGDLRMNRHDAAILCK